MKTSKNAKKTNGFATTKAALAKACRVSAPTLRKFLKLPGAPVATDRGWRVVLVRQWLLSHAARGDLIGKLDPQFEVLKKWEIYERARRLHELNEREADLLIPKVEKERELAHCIGECQRVLGAIPPRLAPAIVGLTVPAAEQLMKHALEEAIKELHDAGGGDAAAPT